MAKEVGYHCGESMENKLFAAVIQRAILDLLITFKNREPKPKKPNEIKTKGKSKYQPKSTRDIMIEEQKRAHRWIFLSPDFNIVCEYADINPDWLRPKIAKVYEIYEKLYREYKNEKINNTSKEATTT